MKYLETSVIVVAVDTSREAPPIRKAVAHAVGLRTAKGKPSQLFLPQLLILMQLLHEMAMNEKVFDIWYQDWQGFQAQKPSCSPIVQYKPLPLRKNAFVERIVNGNQTSQSILAYGLNSCSYYVWQFVATRWSRGKKYYRKSEVSQGTDEIACVLRFPLNQICQHCTDFSERLQDKYSQRRHCKLLFQLNEERSWRPLVTPTCMSYVISKLRG